MIRTERYRLALALIPALFLGYLFVYPLVRIIGLSLGAGSLGAVADLFAEPRLRQSAWFTVWQAGLSTVLTLLAALPLTAVIARFDFPGRALVRALVTVPFVLPTVVVAAAFVSLGVRGSIWAILAAHVFFNIAVVVRTVGGLWSRIDPDLVAAARTLGASRWQAFRTVTLPLLRPALAAASSIVFLFTFTSFGIVLILGELRFRTLEVEIWQQATSFLDLGVAGALALVQLTGVSAVLALYARYQERQATRLHLVPESAGLRRPAGRGEWAVVGGTVGLTLGALAVPPAILLARSLQSDAAGWRSLVDPPIGVDPWGAIGNSLSFAAVAAAVAVVVGTSAALLVAARRGKLSRWFDVVLMLPLGTSAVTVGFGMLVALDRPVDLRTAWILVPLAHALVAVPFVVRSTVPLLRAIRPALREAAMVLGASPSQVRREIDLPIVTRAVAVGAGFAAAVSLGEFGATAFLVRPDTTTIPTLIFRLLGRPGATTFGAAMALSVVLAALTAGLILVIDRARAGELGSF